MRKFPRRKESQGKEKLNEIEKARLAGVIWVFGSIDVEYRKITQDYRPRIAISMPNPLPFQYKEDAGGIVYAGKRRGHFILMIRKLDLVEKRLKEIRPFISGEEGNQIDLSLEILKTRRSNKKGKEQKLKDLYKEFKSSQKRLENWIKDFRTKCENMEVPQISRNLQMIWNKAYIWEDC